MLYKTDFNRAALNLIKEHGDSADLYAEEQFEKHCEAGDVKEAGWWMHMMQSLEEILDAQASTKKVVAMPKCWSEGRHY